MDLTQVIISLIGLAGTIIATVGVALINKNVTDKAMALQLDNAVKNSVGAMEEVGKHGIETLKPHVDIPGIPPNLQPGVQYVLDHAGESVARFGVTPEKIADKVVAQIGLARIAPPPVMIAPASLPQA